MEGHFPTGHPMYEHFGKRYATVRCKKKKYRTQMYFTTANSPEFKSDIVNHQGNLPKDLTDSIKDFLHGQYQFSSHKNEIVIVFFLLLFSRK